jgi:uncharacterized linocin/CFP29 family protein
MSHLLRSHAPITDTGWERIDDEARTQLIPGLAARALVDFRGPHGWDYSATNLGRTKPIAGTGSPDVSARRRQVLSVVELRSAFTVSRAELDDADRGALDVDLVDLGAAARRIALAENIAVFEGWEEGGIVGIKASSPHPPVPLPSSFAEYPTHVAQGVEVLLRAGVTGPYGLALGPSAYTGVVESTEHGGIVVFDHLRSILSGPIVRTPGLEGAVVVSLRGGDFLFESGQDLSVGYDHHDADAVHLYVEESFTFSVSGPEAAVALGAG